MLRISSRALSRHASLISAAVSLASPFKKGGVGEDAYFLSPLMIGVADGVGGWARVGVDSGEYSRKLMAGCQKRSGESCLEALQGAYEDCGDMLGSSTASLLAWVESSSTVEVLNLGDSGTRLYMKGEAGWKKQFGTQDQTHRFNMPLQLGAQSADLPEHADVISLTFDERTHNLWLTATDGCFDNLFDGEIEFLLNKIDMEGGEIEEELQKTAEKIAKAALQYSLSCDGRTSPFSIYAKECGQHHPGGKPDDITVVLSTLRD